jgi:hypothetical protein
LGIWLQNLRPNPHYNFDVKTPFGFDCPHFFGDYYRGRSHEECRLLGTQASARDWSPDLCRNCPVPAIMRANACQNMQLSATVKKGFLGLSRKMQIDAFCTLSNSTVREPQIGCGQCHPLPPEFLEK